MEKRWWDWRNADGWVKINTNAWDLRVDKGFEIIIFFIGTGCPKRGFEIWESSESRSRIWESKGAKDIQSDESGWNYWKAGFYKKN